MNNIALTFISLAVIAIFFLVIALLRFVSALQKKKGGMSAERPSEVGFVVDTFHNLVAKLKEKERELEVMRRLAEERASSVELYNENILRSVPSGVISFDQQLRITTVNASAERILDIRAADVIGRGCAEVLPSQVAEVIGSHKAVERDETACTTPSGKRIWLGLNVSPLRDSEDRVIGQILVCTDLTELKAFQSQQELRDRLSSLGEMSAGIAHELRNPLAVISGYTKILSKRLEGDLLAPVDAISREIGVMDRIISDFLSFARPSEPSMHEVDIGDLIVNCIESDPGKNEAIEFRTEVSSLLSIRADEVLLRQAFSNLIRNAVEAMPDGGTVTVRGTVGETVDISVSDTGHGIPDEIREKIFLPFYTTKERGTGLGLPIVHKIVVSHGGAVDVETGRGGTTVTIRLPISLKIKGV